MHFSVLCAVPMPQDVSAVINAVPVDVVTGYTNRKLFMKRLFEDKKLIHPKASSELIEMERWECYVEGLLEKLLAPYDENTTDCDFLEFCDQSEEGRKAYEQDCIDCVRTPDGRIISCHAYEFSRRYKLHDGKVYRRSFGVLHHQKRTKKSKKYLPLPNYPLQKLYPTFDSFMTEHWGCGAEKETGGYGYYTNPYGQWDWWQVGGRWPLCFLVKNDCASAVVGEPACSSKEQSKQEAPDGYRWVAGARKCDIAWEVMKEFKRKKYTEQFHRYEEWFATGVIPEEYANIVRLTQDGIVSFGDCLYRKGETLEQHLNKLGISDQNPYPIDTFAYVDADDWNDHGWGHESSADKAQAWFKEVAEFISQQPDETLLVSVDCHT